MDSKQIFPQQIMFTTKNGKTVLGIYRSFNDADKRITEIIKYGERLKTIRYIITYPDATQLRGELNLAVLEMAYRNNPNPFTTFLKNYYNEETLRQIDVRLFNSIDKAWLKNIIDNYALGNIQF